MSGNDVDVSAVGDVGIDSGVDHGDVLLEFTDAVMHGEEEQIAPARDALRVTLGEAAVVDVSGVIAMFNIVDRIADATGIPIDANVGQDIRYRIGRELGMGHLAPEERNAK